MKIIDKRYNPREWNIYPFLFSDGYNWGDQECVELVKKMVANLQSGGLRRNRQRHLEPVALVRAARTGV